ncbi:unnamed protein product [Amoebophrya sp. A120]|nr:unnamed protein product [Amoebophrya sp. A120]|eukprot:GSA120T00011630001.1
MDCAVIEKNREEFANLYHREGGDQNACSIEALGQRVLYGVDAFDLPATTLRRAHETQTGRPVEKLQPGEKPTLLRPSQPGAVSVSGDYEEYLCSNEDPTTDADSAACVRPSYTVIFWNNPYPHKFTPSSGTKGKGKGKNGKRGKGKKGNGEHPHAWANRAGPEWFRGCRQLLQRHVGGCVCIMMNPDQFQDGGWENSAEKAGLVLVDSLPFRSDTVPLYKPSYGDERSLRDPEIARKQADFVSDENTRTYRFCLAEEQFDAGVEKLKKLATAKRRKLNNSVVSDHGFSSGTEAQTSPTVSPTAASLSSVIFGDEVPLSVTSATYSDGLRYLVHMFRKHSCTDEIVTVGKEEFNKCCASWHFFRTGCSPLQLTPFHLTPSRLVARSVCAMMIKKNWSMSGYLSNKSKSVALVFTLDKQRCKKKTADPVNADGRKGNFLWSCDDVMLDFFVKYNKPLLPCPLAEVKGDTRVKIISRISLDQEQDQNCDERNLVRFEKRTQRPQDPDVPWKYAYQILDAEEAVFSFRGDK